MKNYFKITTILILAFFISHSSFAGPSKGRYYFIQAKVSKRSLSNQDNLNAKAPIVQKAGPFDSQRWRFIPAGDGYYYILSKKSGLFLEVSNQSRNRQAIIWQNRASESSYQQWKLVNAGEGYYFIRSKGSGLYLDVRGGSKNDGATIWQFELNRTDAQRWRLIDAGKVYNINKAISANIYTYEIERLYLLGHHFNFGTKEDGREPIKIFQEGPNKVIKGVFVRNRRALFDDTYRFTMVINPQHQIIEFTTFDNSYNGLSGLFGPTYTKEMGNMLLAPNGKVASDLFIGQLYDSIKNQQREYSWRDAADQITFLMCVSVYNQQINPQTISRPRVRPAAKKSKVKSTPKPTTSSSPIRDRFQQKMVTHRNNLQGF